MQGKNPRGALFDAYESPSDEQIQAIALLEEVSRKLGRAVNPVHCSISELVLHEIAEALQQGVMPKIEFKSDYTQMALDAAEISRNACVAALDLLKPYLNAIENVP
jgi:hypothetical protein